MTLSDVNHYAVMVSGCESINSMDYTSPDSKYAQSVLKLHANDLGFFAGQEGFLETVKKGASNIKEWALKLIKAIQDWWKSRKAPKVDPNIIKRLSPEQLQGLENKLHDTIVSLKGKIEIWNNKYNEIISRPGFSTMLSELKQPTDFTKKIYDGLDDMMKIKHNDTNEPYDVLVSLGDFEHSAPNLDVLAEGLKYYIRRTEGKEGSEGTDNNIVSLANRTMVDLANVSESVSKYANKFREVLFEIERNSN